MAAIAPSSGSASETPRRQLLDAREAARRAEREERRENRERLPAIARSLNGRGIQLVRLELPRTEIQLFGNTAIPYYTCADFPARRGAVTISRRVEARNTPPLASG